MELKYSLTGTPYIDLTDVDNESYGRITFSALTKTEAGYKYITFNRKRTVVNVRKVAGRRVMNEVEETDSFTFNLQFGRGSAGGGTPNGTLPPKLMKWVKKKFAKYTVDDVIPFDAIPKIKGVFERADIDKILEGK